MLKDYFAFALTSLRHRQLRTWLTVIGIIIGIASIIALISISQGLENAIVKQFERMGSNRMYVSPENFMSSGNIPQGLTKDDVDTIEKMPEVEWVNPYLIGSDEVEFNKEKLFVQQLVGINTDGLSSRWADMDFKLVEGRLPEKKISGGVVIGYKIATDFFKKDVHLKNKMTIKGKDFRVDGVLEEIGNQDDDTSVWMDIDDFREVFNKPTEVTMIELKLKPGIDVNLAADKISKRLEKARGNDHFDIMTPEQILEQVGELLQVIKIVLGGIAAISLVVGGVGIMNSMYTSVLQRKKEVGIMKSVGAKNMDIMLIFLIESGIIGLSGGILGVVLGSGLALMTEYVAKQAGFGLLSVKISLSLSLFGLLFALIVGMVAGALPARQASRLRPAEALRD
ncbi:ABC transporter permease [Candidatus Woesearchaeota archaeon]|nr:ABC transporter permease [Candidatus Woesearchaeota archaeon]